jgi:dienelactone hydrolase
MLIVRSLAALAALTAFGCAQAAPLDAYGQLPSISDVALSPDGAKVAYITHAPGKEGVVAVQISPAKMIFGGNFGDQKLRGVVWSDNDHLLVIRSVTKKPSFGVIADRQEWNLLTGIDLSTGKTSALLKDVPGSMNTIEGVPERRTVGGKSVIFVSTVAFGLGGGEGQSALLQLDPATSRASYAPKAMMGGGDWVLDPNGEPLAQPSYDEHGHKWSLWLYGPVRPHMAYSMITDIDMPQVQGVSPDGASLILKQVVDEQEVYLPVSLKDGSAGQPIAAYSRFSSLISDPVTGRLIGGAALGATASYSFFDPKDQAAWEAIVRMFPDEEVDPVSWSDDRSRVVVEVTGQSHGVAYVMVDAKTHAVLKVGDAYAALQPDDIAGVEAIEYKAADGRTIPAFLTLPNGRPSKGLPLVVVPHGGPAAMDQPGFDYWAQALASRGYAVLQPEFRGSDGYGREHLAAGFGEWGRKMQTDLSDGVRALANSGIVDPKRVCIFGGSYGGYAALAGVALQSGVYRCAVSVAGISDLNKMMAWTRDREGSGYTPSVRYWSRFMGGDDARGGRLDEISPALHASRVDVPVLLLHGRDDTVVPIQQSQLMADALAAAGKPAEFVILANEDHWLSRSETRTQMLQAAVKFLEANNPP